MIRNIPEELIEKKLWQGNIRNVSIKENIQRTIVQSTQQDINISQSLSYTDRYGYCDLSDITKENKKNNCRHRPDCGRVLKQEIDLRAISVQIINITTNVMMNNSIDLAAESTVVIDRIQNYRVIFLSLIWNILMCLQRVRQKIYHMHFQCKSYYFLLTLLLGWNNPSNKVSR